MTTQIPMMKDPEQVGREAAHLMTLTQGERDEMRDEMRDVDLLVYLCDGGTVEALQEMVGDAPAPDHCAPHLHGVRNATDGSRCRDCGGALR